MKTKNLKSIALLELELMKVRNYYGSKEQIDKEILITKQGKEKMFFNETIEEWLTRVATIEY